MAVSRVPYLHRILEPHLRSAVLGFRFLSSELSSSVSPSEAVAQAPPPSKNDRKVVGRELAMMRREYEKQIAELRKKYAAEEERKRKEKEMVERITRERIVVEKEKRLVLKKERSQIRAVEVEQEQRSLRATLVRFTLHCPLKNNCRLPEMLHLSGERKRERDYFNVASGVNYDARYTVLWRQH